MIRMLNGVIVNVVPPKLCPKEKLSKKVMVNDKFRSEFNHWLGEFFGGDYIEEIPDGVIVYPDNGLCGGAKMNEWTYKDLSATAKSMQEERKGFHYRVGNRILDRGLE